MLNKVIHFTLEEIIAPLAVLTTIMAPFVGAMVYLLFK